MEDLRTSNGPALHVWLTDAPVIEGPDGWTVFDDGRYLDLGDLKGKRELKGFAKVTLEPGESREVTVALDQRAFSFWSELLGRWAVEAGDFVVEVGHHSRKPAAQPHPDHRRPVDRRAPYSRLDAA